MENQKIQELLSKLNVPFSQERKKEIEIVSDFCEKKGLEMRLWKSSGNDTIGFDLFNPWIGYSQIKLYPHWSKAKGHHFLFAVSGEGEIPNQIENLHSCFRNY